MHHVSGHVDWVVSKSLCNTKIRIEMANRLQTQRFPRQTPLTYNIDYT